MFIRPFLSLSAVTCTSLILIAGLHVGAQATPVATTAAASTAQMNTATACPDLTMPATPVATLAATVTATSNTITYQGCTYTVLNPQVIDSTVDGRTLTLTLKARALWAGGGQGPLVYRLVNGDFTVTATVHARRKSDPTKPPTRPVHLGGLMVHNPTDTTRGGTENYVHLVVGNTPAGIGTETKTTVNSVTQYATQPLTTPNSILRICRKGADFTLYARSDAQTDWRFLTTYARPDLPDSLQVGANVYAALPPDLQVSFDDLTIQALPNGASCTS